MIDARIDKPRILLAAGNLVASTDALLRASGVAHERLTQTGVRTPLGEVVDRQARRTGRRRSRRPERRRGRARGERGDDRLGAEQVLIDGAIDRRAASSPAVADGLVMATGAVLSDGHRGGRGAAREMRSSWSGCHAVAVRMNAGASDGSRSRWRRLVLETPSRQRSPTLLREHPRAMHVAGRGRARRALPGGPPGGAQIGPAQPARAEDRRGRSDEGVPVPSRPGLVSPSGPLRSRSCRRST